MLLPRSWRRIGYSSLHASASSLQQQHSPSQRQRTCITLHGWGGYQSYYEPLDKIRVQSGILNPDSLITVTCARLFLLSVSPCVFLFCFFQLVFTKPCIPPLHWSHSQMGLIVVCSLLPFIFASFYSFLLPFLSFLLPFSLPPCTSVWCFTNE